MATPVGVQPLETNLDPFRYVHCLPGSLAASSLLFAGTKYFPVFMTDMDLAYQSWQKILEAGAKVIYPTHGKPFPAIKLKENMGKIRTQELARFF